MINDTLFFMLIVGIIISAGMLFLFIWAAKSGQFDDSNKMVNGLLFDSTDDLNDAIKKEKNSKDAKELKLKSEIKKEEDKEEKKVSQKID
jgi:cbb3-type cytochrome oxidase maturation protein